MIKALTHVSILVLDIDEALKFYTEVLGFAILENETNDGFRWVTVAPKGQTDIRIILLPASDEADQGCCGSCESDDDCDMEDEDMSDVVGRQGVFCFSTENCQKTFEELTARGVEFTGEPEEMPWGIQATFADLYGNCFCIIQAK